MPAHHRIRPARTLGFLSITATLWLAGCAFRPATENVPPPSIEQLTSARLQSDAAENMLDWAGTYQAVLPCQGCPSTAISVQLRGNHTAVVRERSVGSAPVNNTAQTYAGPFRFDPPGSSLIILSLGPQSMPAYQFFVGEGWLEIRNATNGAPLPQSALRLQKTSQTQP